MKSIVEKILLPLMNSESYRSGEFVGCTVKDIEILLSSQNVERLPKIYVDFMKIAGKSDDIISIGSDMSFPEVKNLKNALIELLKEEWPEASLEKDVYVFFSHGGYQFAFFKTIENMEDPKVYYYIFDKKEFVLIYDSFSKWLTAMVDGHLKGFI
jgi:hypothetical protein